MFHALCWDKIPLVRTARVLNPAVCVKGWWQSGLWACLMIASNSVIILFLQLAAVFGGTNFSLPYLGEPVSTLADLYPYYWFVLLKGNISHSVVYLPLFQLPVLRWQPICYYPDTGWPSFNINRKTATQQPRSGLDLIYCTNSLWAGSPSFCLKSPEDVVGQTLYFSPPQQQRCFPQCDLGSSPFLLLLSPCLCSCLTLDDASCLGREQTSHWACRCCRR